MSKLLGSVLILSGIAVAGLAVPLSAHNATPKYLGAFVASDRAGATVVAKAEPQSAVSPLTVPTPVRALRPVGVMMQPERLPAAQLPARKPIGAFDTTTVPNEPAALARALQKELQRVGCYAGAINGVWSPATRKAMKSFTDRVNASLPLDRPDYILLSLVQSQADAVCAANCPAGQGIGGDGRCVPTAILAQAARKLPAQKVPLETEAKVPSASPAAPVVASLDVKSAEKPGAPPRPFVSDTPRMALAGPTVPDVPTPPGPQATTPDTEQPHVKPVKKREKREAHVASQPSAKFGQTRWAREFHNTVLNRGTY